MQADERETTGIRSVLNFGHTFGHALEAVTGYQELLHGEAISIGMICAARLAEAVARVDGQFTNRLRKLLSALELPVDLPSIDREALLSAMDHDKKVEHGRLNFVLPSRLGHVELVRDIDRIAVRATLNS